MDKLIRLPFVALLSVVVMLAPASVGSGSDSPDDGELISTRGLSSPTDVQILRGGMVYASFGEGVRVVAPVGSEIVYGTESSDDGGESWASVTPPGDLQEVAEVDALALAEEVGMVTRGESLALVSSAELQDGEFTAQACVDIDNSNGWAHGCYSRKTGNTSRYWGTSSVVSGSAKGIRSLERLRTRHIYNSTTEIRRWRPQEDISAGSCGSRTIGLSYQGISWSQSSTVCPAKLSPSFHDKGKEFRVTWVNPWYSHTTGTRRTMAVDAVYRKGSVTGFSYRIGFTWVW